MPVEGPRLFRPALYRRIEETAAHELRMNPDSFTGRTDR
jgi:hypothetical protein